MANSDIRLLLSFRNHPKTKKLKLKLGNDGVISLIWLMMFAAENKSDGVFTGMDAEDIGLAADYPGDPAEFASVLQAVRYLDFDGETYALHDWAENNPWAAGAKERSERSRKAANARHHGKEEPETNNQQLNHKKHAPSIDPQCEEQETAVQGAESGNAPSPFLSFPSPLPGGSGSLKDPTEVQPPSHPPPRVKIEKPDRDYSDWQPKESTIGRIKQNCPRTASRDGITDEFITSRIPEFITYAEETGYRPDQMQSKFIRSVTSDFKHQVNGSYRRKEKTKLKMPRDPSKVEAWAREHGYPMPRPGEDLDPYKIRISRDITERARSATL